VSELLKIHRASTAEKCDPTTRALSRRRDASADPAAQIDGGRKQSTEGLAR